MTLTKIFFAVKKYTAVLFCAVLLAGFVTAAAAQDNSQKRHPELNKFVQAGGVVEYMGYQLGLDAWMLTKQDGTKLTVYTTPEGGMVVGSLVDSTGAVATMGQMAALSARQEGAQEALQGALLPDSSASRAERFYAEVETKAAWGESGAEDAPYVYLFFNATCDHCMDFWQEIRGQVKDGNLKVRFVPWGTAEANRVGGAALLSSPNPAQSWSDFIDGKKSALAADKVKDGALAAVDANTALTKKWGVDKYLPFLIYRRPADGKVTAILGPPQNVMLFMADMARN